MNRTDPANDPTVFRLFTEMKERVKPAHNRLVNHPIYAMVQDPEALSVFMASHVFAVWDFMSLLKSLQLSLTCMQIPWRPPDHIEAARLVNEIVVGEETDEIYPGVYISHFELYLLAMEECRADRAPVDALLAAIVSGEKDVGKALDGLAMPDGTRDFVRHTLAMAEQPPHRVAASFLFGRENVIPGMFLQLLAHHTHTPERRISPMRLRVRDMSLKLAKFLERRYSPREPTLTEGPPRGHAFRVYLQRHIDVDGESHGPMGERLLMAVCGRSRSKWDEAEESAVSALNARDAMWHSVIAAIQKDRERIFGAR